MTDLKDIRRREDLPPLERAVSDVLDEYLVRLHGRMSGWVYPVQFLEFLATEGLVVLATEDVKLAADGLAKASHHWPGYGPAEANVVARLRSAAHREISGP